VENLPQRETGKARDKAGAALTDQNRRILYARWYFINFTVLVVCVPSDLHDIRRLLLVN